MLKADETQKPTASIMNPKLETRIGKWNVKNMFETEKAVESGRDSPSNAYTSLPGSQSKRCKALCKETVAPDRQGKMCERKRKLNNN